MNNEIDRILDATGLLCPEPVMLLHKTVREVTGGAIIKMIATDPSTTRDVAKFCHFLGHELLHQESDEKSYTYIIRKSGG
jgi:tRNA 2-thiouridine synthesizing protein A